MPTDRPSDRLAAAAGLSRADASAEIHKWQRTDAICASVAAVDSSTRRTTGVQRAVPEASRWSRRFARPPWPNWHGWGSRG
jgi:hypothetical protein